MRDGKDSSFPSRLYDDLPPLLHQVGDEDPADHRALAVIIFHQHAFPAESVEAALGGQEAHIGPFGDTPDGFKSSSIANPAIWQIEKKKLVSRD